MDVVRLKSLGRLRMRRDIFEGDGMAMRRSDVAG
jgi:hypothetical protein